MAEFRPSDVPGVFTDGESLYTRNLVPGTSVYGERRVVVGDVEYRAWNPHRSKMAAWLRKGVAVFPFQRRSRVLYLGAAQGTTVSHISDLCAEGTVYAVEVSRRAFQNLLELSERRTNVLPILADASRPEGYGRLVGSVDVLYQDVAQRDQVELMRANLGFLHRDGFAILMAKARSADAAARPEAVYLRIRKGLERAGLEVLQVTALDPFQRDHAAILMEKP